MIRRYPKKRFDEICETIDWSLPYRTPLGKGSLQTLYQYGLMANKIDGVAAEAGVFTGYSLYTLAHVFDREIHAFDSWEGVPEPSEHDGEYFKKGYFTASLDMVKERLSFTDKVTYHKGFFADTFPLFDSSIRFAYAFCDVDLYQSVIDCFEFFYPKMNSGGVLIFDDCICKNTPGAKIAIDEMIQKYNIINTYIIASFYVFEI